MINHDTSKCTYVPENDCVYMSQSMCYDEMNGDKGHFNICLLSVIIKKWLALQITI